MVLTHHLLQILDKASLEGRIENSIKIVSFANPIGLSQVILGSHIGRFSIDSGINFNREWPNVTQTVISNIQPHLIKGDSNHNVKLIRKTILEVLETEYNANRLDKALKKELYKMASVADIVLDLHCDNGSTCMNYIFFVQSKSLRHPLFSFVDAVMHLYTHDRLWPQIADLAAELTAQCTLLAAYSGGEPCDEACSALWAAIADAYPEYAIPMACEAVTVELRGETDVRYHPLSHVFSTRAFLGIG
jgi:predicted deacylase